MDEDERGKVTITTCKFINLTYSFIDPKMMNIQMVYECMNVGIFEYQKKKKKNLSLMGEYTPKNIKEENVCICG